MACLLQRHRILRSAQTSHANHSAYTTIHHTLARQQLQLSMRQHWQQSLTVLAVLSQATAGTSLLSMHLNLPIAVQQPSMQQGLFTQPQTRHQMVCNSNRIANHLPASVALGLLSSTALMPLPLPLQMVQTVMHHQKPMTWTSSLPCTNL